MVNLAIIGDVHLQFSQEDVTYFNASTYDLILFVGDLSNYSPRSGYRLAGLISRLKKPTLFIPGNHDTVNLFQLVAEIKQNSPLTLLFGLGHRRRERTLQRRLGEIVFCGYSSHHFSLSGESFDVIAGRPYSMGGPEVHYKRHLRDKFNVDSMEASARLLRKRIDETESDRLIFLAHNGPQGLGSTRSDIWGCDFLEEEGDYGDEDLAIALEYAREIGKRIIAVVAGHMHHQLKGGGSRQWYVKAEGVHYINAARVPRIFQQMDRRLHHHVRLSFDEGDVEIEEMWV